MEVTYKSKRRNRNWELCSVFINLQNETGCHLSVSFISMSKIRFPGTKNVSDYLQIKWLSRNSISSVWKRGHRSMKRLSERSCSDQEAEKTAWRAGTERWADLRSSWSALWVSVLQQSSFSTPFGTALQPKRISGPGPTEAGDLSLGTPFY